MVPLAVENFRFLDLRIHLMADPEAAAEIRADALIKATGRRIARAWCSCAARAKITHLREYFRSLVRAAKALDAPISDASD